MITANDIINFLKLIEHPEGGYFREIYRSECVINQGHVNGEINSKRNFSTSIYYLLESGQISKFHRLKSDEIWHFYSGSPLLLYIIDDCGELTVHHLGIDLNNGDIPQILCPAGYWFGAEVLEKNSYSFVGCTVSPGFDYKDFELANREKLISEYPKHTSIITKMT